MDEQRTRARASWKGGHKEVANPVYAKLAETYRTEPDFYFGTTARDCRIEAIITKAGAVNELPPGEEGEIVLDRTVFYSESGGQVSDIGTLWNNERTVHVADVQGAYYPVSGLIAHRVVAKEKLAVGDRISGDADAARREHIKRNHTGTHLMHAALRNILGTHVKQAGSLVEPTRLRFDFSHFAAIDPAELRDIEQQVNDEILLNSEIQTNITTLDDALASGALAFFGDRYPEQNVRVVTIPDPSAPRGFYSKELCGGTHVRRTGDIGVFKIVVEQSAAAGVRRIEAITGAAALADYQRAQELLREISARMGVNEENLAAAIERTAQTQKQLEKQLEAVKRKGALSKLDELAAQARTIKGVKVISAELEGVDREAMRQLVDSLRQKLGSGVVVLGTAEDGKVALLAGITKDLTSKLHAGKVIQAIAKEVGGSGGGRPDLAEAGGKDTFALKSALAHVYPLIDQLL
jgi:alanyl-tRNA synthetase